MDSHRITFTEDIVRTVKQLCKVTFNVTSTEELSSVFGLSNSQLKMVIKKIVDALPDIFFEKSYFKKKEQLKAIVAREFIFFQVQERWDDPQYQANLANFIRAFSRDIEKEF